MTKLSVNINKVATLRNARGGNLPNVLATAVFCESFGAQGITVHPRPDERHIRYSDVRELKSVLKTEFNIEGNPIESYINLVLEVKPTQVTLVPDGPDQLTSNHGWDTINNKGYLQDIIGRFKEAGIRTSIFVDPVVEMVQNAKDCGTDRVELYTEAFASGYSRRDEAIKPYVDAAVAARECGLGLNAGHDLNLENLTFFHKSIPWLDEVSIGHALISDALYMGLKDAICMYKRCLL